MLLEPLYYTASNVLPDLPPVFSLSLCQHIYTLHKRKEDPTAGQLQSLAKTYMRMRPKKVKVVTGLLKEETEWIPLGSRKLEKEEANDRKQGSLGKRDTRLP